MVAVPENVTMRRQHPAGQPAPVSATYELRNVFGTAAGVRVRMPRGQILPDALIGHDWTVAEEYPEDC
jgi:hypothetical protein